MVASNLPEDAASDAPDAFAEMARIISEKKRAANRANARKSTGPKTDDGKKIASLNAVKHGVHAKAALLPGEDPAELDALDRGLRRDLRPIGMMQEIVVERIVSLAWKLRRIAYAEEAALELDRQSREHTSETRAMFGRDPLPPITGGLALAIDVAARQEGRLDKLLELELKVQRAMQQAINLLSKLKKERPEDAEEEPLESARVIASDARIDGDRAESRVEQNEATEARGEEPLSAPVAEEQLNRQNEATDSAATQGAEAPLTPSPGTPGEGWGGGAGHSEGFAN